MNQKILSILAFCLIAIVLMAGCAKEPAEDIHAAKTAVDAVIAEGGEKYASEDVKKINDTLTAAMDEIKAQDDKMMKNYAKAKELLAQAKTDAEALKVNLPVKKEESKMNALAAQEAAKTALADAKAMLAKAPKGKGSRADIEAMRADLNGLEETLTEVQAAIDSEDYTVASQTANSIMDKSSEVSAQITSAMEKVGQTK